MAERGQRPAEQPGWKPLPGDPAPQDSLRNRVRLRNPQSVGLIAVIATLLVAAGLLAAELYARHRAETIVAAVVECAVHDQARVSFGTTPLLRQLATRHFSDISIHTA